MSDEHESATPRIEVIDGTVRRPKSWWSQATQSLLGHLESVGFPYSPRVLGTDADGREILTYIEGISGREAWGQIVADEGLRSFAGMLRTYHDAVRNFRPPLETEWAFGFASVDVGDLICHGDFGPWNLVWREGRPVGILDWDFAFPGPPIHDIAYALEYAAPYRDDEECMRWLGYSVPPDRNHRIQVFLEAYGLPNLDGITEEVLERMRLDATRVSLLANRGQEPQASWVSAGELERLEARANWVERNRGLF